MDSNKQLNGIKKKLENKVHNLRFLVIGDVMLDEYITGEQYKMSDEAPVPVLKVGEFRPFLGGAANVANNLNALGANVEIAGIIGKGYSSQRILECLGEQGISNKFIYTGEDCLTTTKSRVVINGQQIVRFDYEDGFYSERTQEEFYKTVIKSINFDDFDAIVFSDYNKGVVCCGIVDFVSSHTIKNIFVDPSVANFNLYGNIYCVKLNAREFFSATKKECNENTMKEAAYLYNIKHLIVTSGPHGCYYYDSLNRKFYFIENRLREVKNTIGAGDSFLSGLVCSSCCSETLSEAVYFANNYAAVNVSKAFTSTATLKEI